MFDSLPVAAGVFAGIAAVIHVYIFLMESVLWSRPDVWPRFGVGSQGEADILRPMAFNQGFYNLFLAIMIVVGIVLALMANGATEAAGIGMV